MKKIENGFLGSFEGFECAGKSTAIRKATEVLRAAGYDVVVSREPGATDIGSKIRHLLFTEANNMESATEAMLFYSDRIEHNAKVIKPALAAGKIVLTDRYYDSTRAYQGALGNNFTEELHEFMLSSGLLQRPNLSILFDVDMDTYRERKNKRGVVAGEEINTFEDARQADYHQRVINNFRTIIFNHVVDRLPGTYRMLDASGTPDEVLRNVLEYIGEELNVDLNRIHRHSSESQSAAR